MKFANYDPTQKLNTIQGSTQASGNEMAYGGNQQGLSSLGKAIGDLGSTMLQIQKQKELVDVVNATNEYTEAMNQAMYDPDNGLMNRKGENALNIPTDYSEIESVKRNEIMRKYGFKMTDSINAFNKVVDNDRINTINTINRYVRGQYEDSAMKALNMNIQNIANNGVVNSNPDSFGQTMQQISGSVHAQLANLGYDDNTINLQVKKAQQNTAVTMIEKKISDDDLDGANKMINAAAESGLIDEKEIMGYRQKVRKASMVLATGNEKTIRDVIGEFDPYDPDLLNKVTNKLFESGFGKVAGSTGEATVENLKAAVMGQELMVYSKFYQVIGLNGANKQVFRGPICLTRKHKRKLPHSN